MDCARSGGGQGGMRNTGIRGWRKLPCNRYKHDISSTTDKTIKTVSCSNKISYGHQERNSGTHEIRGKNETLTYAPVKMYGQNEVQAEDYLIDDHENRRQRVTIHALPSKSKPLTKIQSYILLPHTHSVIQHPIQRTASLHPSS